VIHKLDHIALGVRDIDAAIEFFSKTLGYRVGRRGRHGITGRPINFIWEPGSGVKIELIEAPSQEADTLFHLAFTSDNLEKDSENLKKHGCTTVTATKRNEAAKMWTVHFKALNGYRIQLCRYDDDAAELNMPDS